MHEAEDAEFMGADKVTLERIKREHSIISSVV
jgi:hypothetical protein